MDDVPKQNTGVIEGSGTKSLFVAGTIPYEVRNPSGEWRPYLVTEEHQYSHNTDTMACVSFSCNNLLEIQNKFLTGVEVNFSDRFLAKMSGTTPQGNYLDVVANTARNIGLVKEEEWPAPDDYTWNSYYSAIPQDVINKAVKLDIAFESIGPEETSLLYHLKQAPIQITIPEPYPNHAVVLVAIENGLAYYFDTYSPYLKSISLTKIHAALKIVLKGTMNPNVTIYKVGQEYQLAHRGSSEAGFAQQLLDAGCSDLLLPNGLPDFAKIDQIAHQL